MSELQLIERMDNRCTDIASERELEADVSEEGPRRGFSLVGWKEKRPRKGAKQAEECLGQSFRYMVARKTATLAAVMSGTSQAECLFCLCARAGGGAPISVALLLVSGGEAEAEAEAGAGASAVARRGLLDMSGFEEWQPLLF